MIQYVDPEVTKIKFEKEILEFQQNEVNYKKRGVLCTKIAFPEINLLFAVPHIRPQPIAFAININYSNWDSEPPSVHVIDPFTEDLINRKCVNIQFLQWNSEKESVQDLLQDDKKPFFCIQGTKEYHHHPAHSGDSWMLHRTKGEGKLLDLLEKLIKHSIAQAGGYLFNVNGIQINFPSLMIGIDNKKMKL